MYLFQQPQDEDTRRQCARESVDLAGSAFSFGRSRSVIISDLSPRGAQLAARDLPPVGEDLLVVAGSFDTFGTVKWRSMERCGIEFDDVVADGCIAQMKQEAEWVSVAGWMR